MLRRGIMPPNVDAVLRRELGDSQTALLVSPAGLAALQLLLPFLRELALWFELGTRGNDPKWLADLPGGLHLKSTAALERLRIRAATSQKR
jgi:hypothetical protein